MYLPTQAKALKCRVDYMLTQATTQSKPSSVNLVNETICNNYAYIRMRNIHMHYYIVHDGNLGRNW